MPWDRVHEEAEVLEHHISEELEELIAAKLGQPARDPHGDPIPSRELDIADGRDGGRCPSSRSGSGGDLRAGLRQRPRDAPLPRRARDPARRRAAGDRARALRGPDRGRGRGRRARARATPLARRGCPRTLQLMSPRRRPSPRSSTRFPRTGPTSSSTCGSPTRAATSTPAVMLSQINAQPYSRADWHWRINVAHQLRPRRRARDRPRDPRQARPRGHRRRARASATRARAGPRSSRCGAGPRASAASSASAAASRSEPWRASSRSSPT